MRGNDTMPNRSMAVMTSVLLLLIASGGAATAQLREGRDAFGDWRLDKPGTIRLIKPKDLPEPGATPSAANVSRIVAKPANANLQVPPGFKVELFAEGLSEPRIIRVAPNGDIFIAETRAGRIRVLRAPDGAAKPATNEIYATGLRQPFGIAVFPSGDDPQWVYVGNTDSVVRFPYRSGDVTARGPAEVIVPHLPVGGHRTRDVVFSLDGKTMYVSVGSASNVGDQMG